MDSKQILSYREARAVQQVFLTKLPHLDIADILIELDKWGLRTTYNLARTAYSRKLTLEYAFCQYYKEISHLVLVNSNRYLLAKIKYCF